MALIEYPLTYVPLNAVKKQIVADFIVDHFINESPLNYLELEPQKLYFEGSSHKNGTGVRILIISPTKILTKFKYKVEGLCSNNEAEYGALIARLENMLELGAARVKIMGDYELVTKQISKEYKCVKENLIMNFVIANRLLRRFETISAQHIPRIKNQEANDLAQINSRYKFSKKSFRMR